MEPSANNLTLPEQESPEIAPLLATPRRFSLNRVYTGLLAVWVVGVFSIGIWATYFAPVRNDQYQLINLGQSVANGGRMYVDAWENKPPGIAWIAALGYLVTPQSRLAIWIFPGALGMIAVVFLWRSIRSIASPRVARRSVLLTGVVATLRLYDAPSINPDYFCFTFELMAICSWIGALSASRRLTRAMFGIGAGLLWACATSFKQVGCVGLIAVALVSAFLAWRKQSERRKWTVSTIWSLTGFALGISVVTTILYSRGTLGEAAQAIFSFNARFVGGDSLSVLSASWPRLVADLTPIGLAIWLAMMAIVATLWRGRDSLMNRPWIVAMVFWWLMAATFALLGPSGSMRYWQGTWTPMLMLAIAGIALIDDTTRAAERKYRPVLTITFVTLVAIFVHPLLSHYRLGLATSYRQYAEHPNDRDKLAEQGDQVAKVVPKGESIYVLAYDAGVYVHSRRTPASRFVYPRSKQQMEEILATIASGKPYAILIPPKRSPEFSRWCDEACWEEIGEAITQLYPTRTGLADYTIQTKHEGTSVRGARTE